MIKEGYTRVTDALYFISGLKHIDPEIVAKAAKRGQKVHDIIDDDIAGYGVFDVPTECEGYIKSYLQWKGDKKFFPKPERFYDHKYKITGECDQIYENGTGYTLVDFKTPASEKKTWKLQGAAYAYLCQNEGPPIDKIEFVRLSKTGGKPVSYFYSYEDNWKMYLECLNIYRAFFEKEVIPDYLDYV